METRNTTFALLYLCLFTCLQSCGQAGYNSRNKNTKIETYDKYRTQHLEYRDSLLVFHIAQEWGLKNVYPFEDFSKMNQITNAAVTYFLGGSFYSPDRLKMMVWVGEKLPNAKNLTMYNKQDTSLNRICPTSGDTVYNMVALIGIRIDTSKLWEFYPFTNQTVYCFDSPEEVINIMGQYYFEKMKSHTMWRLMQSGMQKGEEVSTPYAYNLQDEGFWEKCWLWEKDTITSDGLYPFQKKGYSHIGFGGNTKMRADPVSPPKIEYPDYILKLYK